MSFEKKSSRKQWNGRSNHSSSIARPSSKRSALTPLMTEEQKSSANIQDLSYDFACRIIRLCQYLTDPISDNRYAINDDDNYSSRIANHSLPHAREYIISKQVYRSGTSIGANVREAQHGQSDADFLTKMTIAFKEADETEYWLSLLHDNGYLNDGQYASLRIDIQRILRLLTSITKSTKERIDKAKNR